MATHKELHAGTNIDDTIIVLHKYGQTLKITIRYESGRRDEIMIYDLPVDVPEWCIAVAHFKSACTSVLGYEPR